MKAEPAAALLGKVWLLVRVAGQGELQCGATCLWGTDVRSACGSLST